MPIPQQSPLTGSCMCNAVHYEVHGPMRDIIACHCNECRKTSGHFTASTSVRPKSLRLIKEQGLRWYRSSPQAQRGFCHLCGSTLFWKPDSGDRVSIYAGSLDQKHTLQLTAHIFVKEKGDYYSVVATEAVDVYEYGGANLNVEQSD